MLFYYLFGFVLHIHPLITRRQKRIQYTLRIACLSGAYHAVRLAAASNPFHKAFDALRLSIAAIGHNRPRRAIDVLRLS